MGILSWLIGGKNKKDNDEHQVSEADTVAAALGGEVIDQGSAKDPVLLQMGGMVVPIRIVGVIVRRGNDKLAVREARRKELLEQAHQEFLRKAADHGYAPVVCNGGYAHPAWFASKVADVRYASGRVRTDVWGRRRAA